jgi:hypothetical protein
MTIPIYQQVKLVEIILSIAKRKASKQASKHVPTSTTTPIRTLHNFFPSTIV